MVVEVVGGAGEALLSILYIWIVLGKLKIPQEKYYEDEYCIRFFFI